jgi:hypothetical protein
LSFWGSLGTASFGPNSGFLLQPGILEHQRRLTAVQPPQFVPPFKGRLWSTGVNPQEGFPGLRAEALLPC